MQPNTTFFLLPRLSLHALVLSPMAAHKGTPSPWPISLIQISATAPVIRSSACRVVLCTHLLVSSHSSSTSQSTPNCHLTHSISPLHQDSPSTSVDSRSRVSRISTRNVDSITEDCFTGTLIS
ncbi:hypothetical protein KC19_3G051400 [Ceratodon purpureus]|uniref:Secreted protein n=1 Tax=Ceratodon purpureus TaxID=3225 RepID=A0A8T0IID2_CERPU|nr:hypothetical protein KC19_3G051400 [Ceratodon purpureus]